MKQKNNLYAYLLALLATIVTSCTRPGYGNDEEVLKKLELQKKKSEEAAKKHQHNIAHKESCKDSLEKNNKDLEVEMQEKKQEVKEVLQEVYDDSRLNESFPANCTVCSKTVNITYGKFYEMVSRYNTGSSRHEAYKEESVYEYKSRLTPYGFGAAVLGRRGAWATMAFFSGSELEEKIKVQTGTRKYDFKTSSFSFHKCPQCVTEKDISEFLNKLEENKEELAQIEAKLGEERSQLNKAQEKIEVKEAAIQMLKKYKEDAAKKDEEAARKDKEIEELKKEQVEQEKNIKRNKNKIN